MARKFATVFLVVLLFAGFAKAQTAEVKVALSEQFFDVLLEAVFTNLNPPAYPIGEFRRRESEPEEGKRKGFVALTSNRLDYGFKSKNKSPAAQNSHAAAAQCAQSIKLEREIGGVRTAVRFRDGRIYAPIAFTGAYNPPFVGCLEFRGWAETNVELEFDRDRQSLVGRARVLNVRLEGVPGMAGGVLTPLVQSAIDRRVNPISILPLEKVSFVVPVEKAGILRVRATRLRHEVAEGVLNIFITYEFAKGD